MPTYLLGKVTWEKWCTCISSYPDGDGRQSIILTIFAENFMKIKNIGLRGARIPDTHPRSAIVHQKMKIHMMQKSHNRHINVFGNKCLIRYS